VNYDERTHDLADRVLESDAFLAREEAGRGEGTYHLRDGGLAVVLRHGTADVAAFRAVFADRVYDPPADARLAILRGSGPRRIVDLHAHVGLASTYLLALWPGAQVTAVEADASDRAVLERCAAENAGAGDWDVLGDAVAPRRSSTCAGEPTSSSSRRPARRGPSSATRAWPTPASARSPSRTGRRARRRPTRRPTPTGCSAPPG
jgi:hypothetical protein